MPAKFLFIIKVDKSLFNVFNIRFRIMKLEFYIIFENMLRVKVTILIILDLIGCSQWISTKCWTF